ncbi:MAG TPA: hypothetical protein PKV15_06680 [Syntrophomonadaceae bacterium]|nr:hypothetical protein [Syntrophomonadaceae bacterium]HRX21094.1 hypothetical protein [Syntrophomonadaceae bacterium]
MELLSLENFRFIDRDKAGANAYLDFNGRKIHAEFNFYLQGKQCLSIRLGRHDKEVETELLEAFIRENHTWIRKMVEPDIIRIRQERLDKMMQASQEI